MKLVKVRVIPDARKEKVEPKKEFVLDISVREQPVRGEATRRVKELVALHYGVPARMVKLRSGARSHTKVFELSDGLGA